MKRTRIAITVAAVIAAAPAFAQMGSSTTAATGTASDQHSGTMGSSTQKAATPRNHASAAQRAAADQGRTPLCSELGQPNAGKLAGKTTGMAADHSASAVHMDCIPDGSTTASAGTSTNVARNNNSVTGSTSAGVNSSTKANAGSTTSKTPSSTGR